jgi:hypothetical protein
MTPHETAILNHVLQLHYKVVGKVKELDPNLAIDMDCTISHTLELLALGRVEDASIWTGVKTDAPARYEVHACGGDDFQVWDSHHGMEVAMVNSYDTGGPIDGWTSNLSKEDSLTRAEAIANALNATSFNWQPEFGERIDLKGSRE